ncbi:MAG: TolC family protein [Rhizobiaceae bacterium]
MKTSGSTIRRLFGASALGAGSAVALALFTATGIAEEAEDYQLRQSIDHPVVNHANNPLLHKTYLRTRTVIPISADSLGIRRAVETAVAYDPEFRRTIEDAKVRRSEVWRAYAGFLPTVKASIRHSHGTDIVSTSRSNNTEANETVVSVEASLPIVAGGSRIFRLKRTRAERAAAEYDALAKGNDVIAGAALAYLDLLTARKRQEALKRNTQAVARIVQITRSKHAKGFADRSDISLAEAKFAQVKREYELAVERRELAEHEFRSAVGDLPGGALSEPEDGGLPVHSADEAVAMALQRNPRLLAAHQSARAAKFAVREAVGERMPRIDLTSKYENGIDGFDQGESWNVGVQLTVPLIDPDAIPAISRSRHEAAAARYAAQDTARDVEKLVRDLWSTHHSAGRQLRQEGKRLSALRKAAQAATKRYKHGYAAIDDVLSRQLEVLDAEIAVAELRAQYKASAYRIAIEIGA